jgi:glutamate N-acetyltransferase/amino-acid N-acetyltransferase
MEWLSDGSVTSPRGFVAGTFAAGLKKNGRPDLALLKSAVPASCAAVFTRNQVVAAPVILDRETLQANNSAIVGVAANSGNANASTGAPGMANARQMQEFAAAAFDCSPSAVLVLSTGVIGVQLPMDKITDGISGAAANLGPANGPDAAEAITTTDTVTKHAAVRVTLPGGEVTIGGMSKGSGMVHPNMATILGVFTTDAAIEAGQLQSMLETAVNLSFNRISVDGDTSTNDTVLLLANGQSGVPITDAPAGALFQEALNRLALHLAQMIVRDGEGASKFVEITVTGAPDDEAAHLVANTIATSALVKTAFAGSDANWGRILAAAGRAGVPFDQDRVALWVGVTDPRTLQLVSQGTPTAYQEHDAAAIFAEPEFKVLFDLAAGSGTTTVWTSDLTHEYVTINADYRT